MKTNEEYVEEFNKHPAMIRLYGCEKTAMATGRLGEYEGEFITNWLRTTLEAKDKECLCKEKGVIELIEDAVREERNRIWHEHLGLGKPIHDVLSAPTKTDEE